MKNWVEIILAITFLMFILVLRLHFNVNGMSRNIISGGFVLLTIGVGYHNGKLTKKDVAKFLTAFLGIIVFYILLRLDIIQI